jgi:hypothetical protein
MTISHLKAPYSRPAFSQEMIELSEFKTKYHETLHAFMYRSILSIECFTQYEKSIDTKVYIKAYDFINTSLNDDMDFNKRQKLYSILELDENLQENQNGNIIKDHSNIFVKYFIFSYVDRNTQLKSDLTDKAYFCANEALLKEDAFKASDLDFLKHTRILLKDLSNKVDKANKKDAMLTSVKCILALMLTILIIVYANTFFIGLYAVIMFCFRKSMLRWMLKSHFMDGLPSDLKSNFQFEISKLKELFRPLK